MTRQIARCAAFVLVATLGACGGGDRGSAASAASDFCAEVLPRVESYMSTLRGPDGDRYGGTVVVASIGEVVGGMGALTSSDYTANQHQVFVNQMPLVRVDEKLAYQPYLARSWEWNADGTELTFHLRRDIFWHDGVKTTAEDVAFTYTRATDPETAFPNAAFWTHYVKGPEGVEVVDSFTVRLRLQPHAEPLDPWRAMAIMPKHLLEDVPPAQLALHPYNERCPVGNGPFRFVSHRQDESWAFEANPAFPADLGGRPLVDRYIYRIVPEQTTLLTDLLTGNIDIFVAPRAEQVGEIVSSDRAALMSFPFRAYTYVAWNTRRPQLADARVRRAITMATNRAALVEALLEGRGVIANHGVPRFHWAYTTEFDGELTYDPAGARALLDEAGWKDRDGDGVRENASGEPLAISIKYNTGNKQRQDVAEIMQAQLREVGIRVRPEVVEWATLLQQVEQERDFDGWVAGWITELKMDDTDLFHSEKVTERYAFAGLQDAELDQLLDTLQVIPDREAALPYWRALQKRMIELTPYTYLFFPDRLEGVSTRLRDVDMDVRGEWVSITDWWIPADQRKYGGTPVGR